MTLEETGTVLVLASAYDQRTVGDSDIRAWHDAIGDLDMDDCYDAVKAHYRSDWRRVMPADVRKIAKALREDRSSHRPLGEQVADPRAGRAFGPVADRQALPPGPPYPSNEEFRAARSGRDPRAAQALALPCPWCGVPPGRWCESKMTGRALQQPHPSRMDSVEWESV